VAHVAGTAVGVLDPARDVALQEGRIAVDELNPEVAEALEAGDVPVPQRLAGGEGVTVDPVGPGASGPRAIRSRAWATSASAESGRTNESWCSATPSRSATTK
jgi:hypothetical protein